MDLTATNPVAPVALTQAETDAIRLFALAEKSPATRRAYASDFAMFTTWCRVGRGIEPLGVMPDLVAAYLTEQTSAGVKPATLTRRLAAIGYAHKPRTGSRTCGRACRATRGGASATGRCCCSGLPVHFAGPNWWRWRWRT